ncbi:hypothetical protein HYV50_02040 [Candidatus Pacearchaeota archaeon]|nr:hypothetical protein [Candidatus Pacearchaeota archaeon]
MNEQKQLERLMRSVELLHKEIFDSYRQRVVALRRFRNAGLEMTADLVERGVRNQVNMLENLQETGEFVAYLIGDDKNYKEEA